MNSEILVLIKHEWDTEHLAFVVQLWVGKWNLLRSIFVKDKSVFYTDNSRELCVNIQRSSCSIDSIDIDRTYFCAFQSIIKRTTFIHENRWILLNIEHINDKLCLVKLILLSNDFVCYCSSTIYILLTYVIHQGTFIVNGKNSLTTLCLSQLHPFYLLEK